VRAHSLEYSEDHLQGVSWVWWGPEFWKISLQSKILYSLRPPNQAISFSRPSPHSMITPWRSTRSTSFRGLITLNNGQISQSPPTSYTQSNHGIHWGWRRSSAKCLRILIEDDPNKQRFAFSPTNTYEQASTPACWGHNSRNNDLTDCTNSSTNQPLHTDLFIRSFDCNLLF
jgi:hypothetical protein